MHKTAGPGMSRQQLLEHCIHGAVKRREQLDGQLDRRSLNEVEIGRLRGNIDRCDAELGAWRAELATLTAPVEPEPAAAPKKGKKAQ